MNAQRTMPVWWKAGAVIAMLLTQSAEGVHHYVNKTNAAPVSPYTTPADAANTIQEAIDVAAAGATVMVYAATYDVGGITGGTVCSEPLTNRVCVDKAITVRSVDNDPSTTIIKGAWDPVSTNGPAAVRGVYLTYGASLIGFTITNGATCNAGDGSSGYRDRYGGGILARSSSCVISNCIITGNAADGSPGGSGGGGASSGTYYDCRFIGNRIGPRYSLGGGAFNAILHRCLLVGNVAERGGGAFRGELYDCVVSNNIADKNLTGTSYSTGGGIAGWSNTAQMHAYNCLIIGNQGDRGGGAGDNTVLSNCTVTLNKAPYSPVTGFGGGVYGETGTWLTDCIVSNNTGGGIYRTFTTNCVIVSNSGYAALRPRTLVNSLIAGNGYGIYVDQTWYAEWLVESCTIIGNAGRGLYVANGNVYSRNSIIHGNELDNWLHTGGTLTFENTCTTPAQAGWDASNLAADPKLVDPGSGYGTSHVLGNYRLRGDSPCLNRGAVLSWMTGALDLDDNPRIDQLTGIPDMGCFEYVYRGSAVLIR